MKLRSLDARAGAGREAKPQAAGAAAAVAAVTGVAWLTEVAHWARQMSRGGSVGVFGTSLAGTWVGAVVGERVGVDVDEDPARIGRTFQGRPVVAPADVPADGQVLLALPGAMAEVIGRRLAGGPGRYHLPPPWPGA